MLGFEPIAKGIAFAFGLQTLLENLIRPLADLRDQTDTYHGFLPAALADLVESTALQGPFLMDQATQ
jgi:hypothetical protein